MFDVAVTVCLRRAATDPGFEPVPKPSVRADPALHRASVAIDWQVLLVIPSDQIIRKRMISAGDGAGVLWTDDPDDVHEVSALGVIAWAGRDDGPSGSRYEWTGFYLLCNAAPTPFTLNGEEFQAVDSFYEALKLPEGSSERATCQGRRCLRQGVSLAGFAVRRSRIGRSTSQSDRRSTRPC